MTAELIRVLRSMAKIVRTEGVTASWPAKRHANIRHSVVAPAATLSPWASDQEFLEVYQLTKDNTLVDVYRCYELWDLARQSMRRPGCILEVGVWRGGTGCIMARAVRGSGKTVYLADTFTGVVKAGAMDTSYKGGEHADATEQGVRDLLAATGIQDARILTGVFPEETAHLIEDDLVSLLHIDVDVYESARDVFHWVFPRLRAGAVVVFDDYGFSGCEGVTVLFDELRLNHPEFAYLHNLNGHGVMIKLA
jgi:O-methyltransferase